MSDYTQYEIDCNLDFMANSSSLTVLLQEPECRNSQYIIGESEKCMKSMQRYSPQMETDTIYSENLSADESSDGQLADIEYSGTRSLGTDYSEMLAEYGNFSEGTEDISDSSLEVILDITPDKEEAVDNLTDILDNLVSAQPYEDDYQVTAEKVIFSPDYNKYQSAPLSLDNLQGEITCSSESPLSSNFILCVESDDDSSLTDDSDKTSDFGPDDQQNCGDTMKNLMLKNAPQSPQGTKHLELTKEERRMMIDEMLMLRKDTIEANRRHSWTGNLKLDCSNSDIDASYNKSLNIRKCSVGLDLPPKVSLYSENILKEEETTDTVDRGSIADLINIKQHWEKRFIDELRRPQTKKANKVVRHWSVKLNDTLRNFGSKKDQPKPDISYNESEEMSSFNDSYNENESAIEREIRLALEREESLKREQELRQLHLEKERESGQDDCIQNDSDNTSNEEFQPTYHEMTEADRGHEISKREGSLQQKCSNGNEEEGIMAPTPMEFRETIIQKEMRIQKERDSQFAKQGQDLIDNRVKTESEVETESKVETESTVETETKTEMEADIPNSSEKPIAIYKHNGENKIARELEEAKQREDEFRKQCMQFQSAKPINNSSPPTNGAAKASEKEEIIIEKDSSNELASSVKSLDLEDSSMSISSDSDSVETSVSKPISSMKHETPIEREIRLAQEREDEFRRQKGFPIEKKTNPSVGVGAKSNMSWSSKPAAKNNPDKCDTMKKIAASRLQNEIKQERSREVTLRDSGRINTTSDERVGEQKKYTEVPGKPMKRNFTTARKASVTLLENITVDSPSTTEEPNDSAKQSGPNYIIQRPKISTTFSYQEAKSNAGSLIEQELREMKEREEELKKQRTTLLNKVNNNESSEQVIDQELAKNKENGDVSNLEECTGL